MTIAEVKSLRSQQRYPEAAKLSRQLLSAQPEDLWLKRNHAWSLYYMVKLKMKEGEKASASTYLEEYRALRLPTEDQLIHEKMDYFQNALDSGYTDIQGLIKSGQIAEALELQLDQESVTSQSLAWTIYYLLKQQSKSTHPDHRLIQDGLAALLERTKPLYELVDKMLLVQLLRLPQKVWEKTPLSPYVEHLGLLEALEPEDFEPLQLHGKTIPSLAERIFIAYSKSLIREQASPEKIENFLRTIVEAKLEHYPHMVYVPYFKAKLLLQTGNPEQGMKAFLPFARKKQREFWVWQVLAECHEQNQELYLACLCKALTCKTKEEFLCGIKERIIPVLIRIQRWDWAKTELDHLISIRKRHDWGLRSVHHSWTTQGWYQLASTVSLKDRYAERLELAEDILSSPAAPTEEILVIVTQVNMKKKVFSFVTPDRVTGFTSFSTPPALGDAYKLQGNFSGSFFKCTSQNPMETEEPTLEMVRKRVAGNLTLPRGKNFGFIEGIFVPPDLIQALACSHGDRLSGMAILAPITPDGPWKWKVIRLDRR